MKYLAYQEVTKSVTYTLYVRKVKKEYVYDIEVRDLISKDNKDRVAKSITTDCQTAFLLLEMLIRQRISIEDILTQQNIVKDDISVDVGTV